MYSDKIPLTSQELYGHIDYDYYSYESKIDQTFLLSNSEYSQYALPAKNSPPQISYQIIKTNYSFVYKNVKEHLLKMPSWREPNSDNTIDNDIFGTQEAYQIHYLGVPSGRYILCHQDKIITIDCEKPLNKEQIKIVIRETTTVNL